jgi:Cys-tRNA(Pro)/Cys-tRNA(Cys) deacylase
MVTLSLRVKQHIESLQIQYSVRYHNEMAEEIRSPGDFAAALGYELARITKSVFCRSQVGGTYALLVSPMDQLIDFKEASRALDNGRLEVATPEQLKQVLGYPRHGVSPFGLTSGVSVLVARQLLVYESILVGGGAVGVEIEVSPHELIRATNAIVGDIAKSS